MININERIDDIIFNGFQIFTSITYTHIITFIPSYFDIYANNNVVSKIVNYPEFSRESLN